MSLSSLLYLGGVSSILAPFLPSLLDPNNVFLPLSEGMSAGSVCILLWAIKILKNERDQLFRLWHKQSEELKKAELKCLSCDYYRQNALLNLLLQP